MSNDETTALKEFRPYIIGGAVMILMAGALAFALTRHGLGTVIPAADKKVEVKDKAAVNTPIQRMDLQAQYAGPLAGTIVQRWRDPRDGTICYIYLPILVRHSPPARNGLVDYGANGIGSISCLPGK